MSSYNAELENFIKELNKFSTTKFILYENKLAKLINLFNTNVMIYSIIERSLKDFNFEIEFKKAMNGGRINLPNKAERLTALVYCILVEIYNKKLDFFKFLKTYFTAIEINLSFAKFIEEMIVPFKNAVISLGTAEPVEAPKPEIVEKELEAPIGFFAIDMLTKLKNTAMALDNCEMAMPIFDAMKWAIDNNDKPMFQSLSCSLQYITKNRKFSKIARNIYNANYNPKYKPGTR